MELVLRIAFNSRVRSEILIKSPVYIPQVGEIVNINYQDFISDKDDVQALNDYDEIGSWEVGFKTVTYKKDKAVVLIVLAEEGQDKGVS